MLAFPDHIHFQPVTSQSGSKDLRYVCCRDGWNNERKAVKLPTLLEVKAIAVWLELTEEEQGEYKTVKQLLCKRKSVIVTYVY